MKVGSLSFCFPSPRSIIGCDRQELYIHDESRVIESTLWSYACDLERIRAYPFLPGSWVNSHRNFIHDLSVGYARASSVLSSPSLNLQRIKEVGAG